MAPLSHNDGGSRQLIWWTVSSPPPPPAMMVSRVRTWLVGDTSTYDLIVHWLPLLLVTLGPLICVIRRAMAGGDGASEGDDVRRVRPVGERNARNALRRGGILVGIRAAERIGGLRMKARTIEALKLDAVGQRDALGSPHAKLPATPGRDGSRSHRDRGGGGSVGAPAAADADAPPAAVSCEGAPPAAPGPRRPAWIAARKRVFERTLTAYEEADHLPMPAEQHHSLYRFEHMAERPAGAWHSSRGPARVRTFDQQARLRQEMDASRWSRAAMRYAAAGAAHARWWLLEWLEWLGCCLACFAGSSGSSGSDGGGDAVRSPLAPKSVVEKQVRDNELESVGKSRPARLPRKQRGNAAAAAPTGGDAAAAPTGGDATAGASVAASAAVSGDGAAATEAARLGDDASVARVLSVMGVGTSAAEAKRAARARTVFQAADADGSGRIELRELREALEQLGLSASAVQVREVMRRHDVDHSGTLDLEEFVEITRAVEEMIVAEQIGGARERAAARAAPGRKVQAGNGACACSSSPALLPPTLLPRAPPPRSSPHAPSPPHSTPHPSPPSKKLHAQPTLHAVRRLSVRLAYCTASPSTVLMRASMRACVHACVRPCVRASMRVPHPPPPDVCLSAQLRWRRWRHK